MRADYRARLGPRRAARDTQLWEGSRRVGVIPHDHHQTRRFVVRTYVVVVAIVSGAFAAVLPAGALAGNPSGTGPPSQSCQEIEKEGGRAPGKASSSPG